MHRLAHWLHWQRGRVVAASSNGVVWIGFRCATCGKLSSVAPTWRCQPPDERFT